MRPLILLVPFVSILPAQEAPAPPAAPVRLGGPEVARLSWDSGSLAPADFDGDGKLDVALLNNENAKLVLLYQRAPGAGADKAKQRVVSRNRWEPVIEDSRFEKASLATDQRHFAMASGDFDGDGKPDLAMTGATDALTVRFQGADAAFSKTWRWKNFEPLTNSMSLSAADLDGDKKADLAVLAKGKLLVFRQKAEGGFGEPVIYVTGEEKAGYLMTEDVDGDGAGDLLYFAAVGEGSLRYRRQTGPGAFASEIAIPLRYPADGGFYTSRDAQMRLVLTSVNGKSGLLERHAIKTAGTGTDKDVLVPTVYAPAGGVKSAVYARADLNGDKLDDLCMADSKAAAINVFLQRADGTFAEPVSFPSFNSINGLAALPVQGGLGNVLAVSSAKEGLGLAFFNADGRLEFPLAQTLKGTPAAMASVDLKGDGKAALAVISGESRDWQLQLISSADGIKWETAAPVPLKALKREPVAVRTGDFNGDGRPDLLVLNGKDPALILLAKGDGSGFEEPLAETATMRSQLADLAPERLLIADMDGNKRAEIIACGTGYARALALSPDGKDIGIFDQFNARQADDKLSAPSWFDADGDGKPDLVFNEGGSGWLQVLQRDAAAVYRPFRRMDAGTADIVELVPVKLGKGALPGLLLAGRERFRTVALSGAAPRAELFSSYETDLKNCRYYLGVPGDLNSDGKEEITVFDSQSKLMEVLSPGAGALPWTSLMHFELFEENIHFRGRKGADNVREVLVRDFTGDNRADLLLLLHDRVLLYPQE